MKYLIYIIFISILISCGSEKNNESTTESTEESAATTEQVSETSQEEVIPDTARLSIEGNDQMQYNKDLLEVYAGQVVELTLKHVGEMSVEAMGHNWVLLKQGTDKSSFAAASVSAKENAYIAPDMEDKVIANTEMLGGGETTTIVFEAPKAGYYDFICSFPGHYGVMQGTFTVKPR